MTNFSIKETKKRGRPRKEKGVVQIPSNLLTVDELSEYLKLSKSHVYTLTSQQKIPHIKLLNKKLLFDKNEINEWLKSKSVPIK